MKAQKSCYLYTLVMITFMVITKTGNASLTFIENINDPVKKGFAIAHEIKNRDKGFGDYVVDAEMVLMQNKHILSARQFHSQVLEVANDGDHSINIFNSPRDVKGTAILTHSHGLTPDDQWLYLPALKRVKRISTRSKSGPFVGSEFAYEDMSTWLPEKYRYRYLGSVALEGADCFKIESTPAYADSGYSKLHQWVDKDIFQPRKIEYFDRKGKLLKTLRFTNYRKYHKNWWRPNSMTMTNHQTGRVTQLLWKNYQFSTGLTESDLTPSKLRRLK